MNNDSFQDLDVFCVIRAIVITKKLDAKENQGIKVCMICVYIYIIILYIIIYDFNCVFSDIILAYKNRYTFVHINIL